MTVTALVVAAGSGQRLGGGLPKQYRMLGGRSVVARAIDGMASHPAVSAVRVVIGPGQEESASQAIRTRDVGDFIIGGAERADSVKAGLAAIESDAVLIHDAARPFCPREVIDRLLASLEFFDGAAPVLPVRDTRARRGETLGDFVDRSAIVRVQTPQAFRLDALR